jgi:hypothetical protein
MPLYDVTGKEVLVRPGDAESYDRLQKARRELGAIRLRKDCGVIDTGLNELVAAADKDNKLAFTKAGFLVGHQSKLPHADVQHVWTSAEMLYPSLILQKVSQRMYDEAVEGQLKFVGGLMRWRVSLRDEIWLVYRRPSGTFHKYARDWRGNPVEITISEYWVNENYVSPNVKPSKKILASAADLAALKNKYKPELRT